MTKGTRGATTAPRTLSLVAHVWGYPPVHNAGAEYMLHSILKWLAARGHKVDVICARAGHAGNIDGVNVHTWNVPRWARRLYERADVAITHLDYTPEAISLATETDTPLVHLIHNSKQLDFYDVTEEQCALAVFNSGWLADDVAWPHRSTVVRPPVFADEYATTPGDAVMMANLTEAKGADVFWEVARALPKRRFIAVLGAYGVQVVPRQVPPNVEIVENTPRMRDVFAQTGIVLMPSIYESWGRVGVEALASGIPTIAHPTPGLKESLGPAGIFKDRDKPKQWVDAIRKLDDDAAAYKAASDKCRKRSKQLDPTADLETFEAELCSVREMQPA